jgi:phosphoribosylformylglycinamidine synthase
MTELTHTLMKVETHNHPTAISPFPGASTGAGGEIRDEGATGRGAKPKAGLTGFTVSNLMPAGRRAAVGKRRRRHRAGGSAQADPAYGKPERIASPLQIMIDGPLGGAAFSNEFGRPVLGGYFRTYEQNVGQTAPARNTVFGYHKPIMIAGGIGNISGQHTHKNDIPVGSLLIQLGGPGMRIGMGGSAASSMATGTNTADLDFDSVQRGNPEMERRAQEVINACWQLGDGNPIISIHDVGAGGLSNAFPEITNDAKRGAIFDLRKVPLEESGMAPKEIWSNESQERYVLAIAPESLPRSPPCASASAACSPWSASPPKSASCADRPGTGNAGRHADGRPARQTAEDAARRQHVQNSFRPVDLTGMDLEEVARACCCCRPWRQILPDHHRRPQRRRHERARPDGRPVAGAGGRLRRHHDELRRLPGRSDGDGRAHAAGRDRRRRLGPHGRGEAITNIAAAPIAGHRRHQAVGQLDGGLRPAGPGRRAVRHRQGGRHGTVPGAGHLDPGRQGFAVDAHHLER